jgi:hypothetical protein
LTASATSALRQLPPLTDGTRLRLRLQTSVTAKNSLGDALIAVVETGPFAGSVVSGRVRVMESTSSSNVLAGIEFMELTRDGKSVRFFAALQQADPAFRGTVVRSGRPLLPGVAYLECPGGREVLLSEGLWFDWQTVPVSYTKNLNH